MEIIVPEQEVLASFFVAGVQFHELKMISGKIKEGTILQLVAEPTNKYDPNAVIIEYENTHIGYVPKRFSAMVSGYLSIEPITCTVVTIDMAKKTYEQLFVELTAEAKDES